MAVAALLVSNNWIPSETIYLLEDKSPQRSPLARWDGPAKLLYENTLTHTDLDSVEGHRLSKPGVWSLSVGDRVEEFDRRLGVPVHVGHTMGANNGTLTARYRFGDRGGLCVVNVDCRKRVVSKLTLYRSNLWNWSIPPLPFTSKEIRETPGAWLSHDTQWDQHSDFKVRGF